MDIERLLVSKIIQENDFTPVADKHITAEYFLNPKNREGFKTIVKHHTDYAEVPSLRQIRLDYPDYKFAKVDESYDFLIDKMREARTLWLIQDGVTRAVEFYDERNAQSALDALASTLSKISLDVPNGRDINLVETGQERLAKYLALRDREDGLLGIPTGFQTLDNATQGFQPGQLNYFVGPAKAGKTSLMLASSISAHLHGARSLFFTTEMTTDEIEQRIDTFRAGISLTRLRTGSLKKEEIQRLERAMHQLDLMEDYWLSADTGSVTGLTGIQSKIERYRPEIVYVDGIYLFRDEETGEVNTPGALTNISRGLKRLAKAMDISMNATTQVLEHKMDKKKGITSNSIGYSSAFAQDADNVFAIESTDDENIRKLKLLLSRNAAARETFIEWDWERASFEELADDPFAAAEDGGWDGAGF